MVLIYSPTITFSKETESNSALAQKSFFFDLSGEQLIETHICHGDIGNVATNSSCSTTWSAVEVVKAGGKCSLNRCKRENNATSVLRFEGEIYRPETVTLFISFSLS